MTNKDEMMKIQREMRMKFAESYADAVRKGEIKKFSLKDLVVGYVDDDGNPVEPEQRTMAPGYLVDDDGNRVGSEND